MSNIKLLIMVISPLSKRCLISKHADMACDNTHLLIILIPDDLKACMGGTLYEYHPDITVNIWKKFKKTGLRRNKPY